MLRFMVGCLLAVVLTGCLQPEKEVEFPVYASGFPSAVQARNQSGATGKMLGFGITEGDTGSFRVSSGRNPPPFDTAGSGGIFPSRSIARESRYFLEVQRAYTTVNRYLSIKDPLNGAISVGKGHTGFPCTLSHPTGYQQISGVIDSVPLVFYEVRLELMSDSLRLILLIDTAASRAADARVDFTGKTWIYGSARATCPDPG
jgi:hypothetical protein